MALKIARPQPLEGHLKFSSSDLDESRDTVGKIFCSHKIEVTGAANQLLTQLHEAEFCRSSLAHTSYGAAVNINTGRLNSYYLVQVPWEGSIEVTNGKHSDTFKPGVASIISSAVPMQMRWSPGASFYTVKLSKHALESKLATLLDEEVQSPLVFEPVLDLSSPHGKRWNSAVEFVRQQLTLATPDSLEQAMAQQLEDTLCLMALELLPHNYSNKPHGISSELAPKCVRRARQYILSNIENDITLEDLAAYAGISPSSLSRQFRNHQGQTPMQFIRAKKLDAVKKILKQSNGEASVTDIALRYGFNHLGRFSHYYREQFGESPSTTLKNN
ncbi:MAG: AraC family transcriptional regulator [Halioglobus sp.]